MSAGFGGRTAIRKEWGKGFIFPMDNGTEVNKVQNVCIVDGDDPQVISMRWKKWLSYDAL